MRQTIKHEGYTFVPALAPRNRSSSSVVVVVVVVIIVLRRVVVGVVGSSVKKTHRPLDSSRLHVFGLWNAPKPGTYLHERLIIIPVLDFLLIHHYHQQQEQQQQQRQQQQQ
uniref:Uncharacterized protein n=1 Tax=Vespula pensylvanica TaxID=30213 RepID=A0A834UFU7_VESPE|nr:hypothetical protein H0235_000457 [Vespula pensylvanica]